MQKIEETFICTYHFLTAMSACLKLLYFYLITSDCIYSKLYKCLHSRTNYSCIIHNKKSLVLQTITVVYFKICMFKVKLFFNWYHLKNISPISISNYKLLISNVLIFIYNALNIFKKCQTIQYPYK